MMVAAIILGTGLAVEFYAILRAPLGYQDDKGFHVVAESIQEKESRPCANPS
jgi:hypothetical protein